MKTENEWIERVMYDYNENPTETLMDYLESMCESVENYLNNPDSASIKGHLEIELKHIPILLKHIRELK